jgi:hypothetical protein
VWCVAIGAWWTHGYTETEPMAEQYDGQAWSFLPDPLAGPGYTTWLAGVSCVDTSFCMAVGTYEANGVTLYPLAELYDGSSWSILPNPEPTGA